MGYLTWWNFPMKAWLIIIVELGVIASLSTWLYLTYLNNIYFQTYVNSLFPILFPVLSVVFGISSASIATYLYFGMKRIRTSQEPEPAARKRANPRKTPKHPQQSSASEPKPVDLSPHISAKLRPIAPPQSQVQAQNPSSRDRENRASNTETRK